MPSAANVRDMSVNFTLSGEWSVYLTPWSVYLTPWSVYLSHLCIEMNKHVLKFFHLQVAPTILVFAYKIYGGIVLWPP